MAFSKQWKDNGNITMLSVMNGLDLVAQLVEH